MDIDKNFIPRPKINKPSKLARAVGAPVGRCSGGQLKSTLVATTSDILPPLRFECFQFEKIISNFPPTWLVIVQLGLGFKLSTKIGLHTHHHHHTNFLKGSRPSRKLRFGM